MTIIAQAPKPRQRYTDSLPTPMSGNQPESHSENQPLSRTPLNGVHRECCARMVDFGGWDMPVQYSGIVDEHNTVRTGVGLFDVSHMGEIEIRGPEALKLVDSVSTNAASRLAIGQAHYSGLLYGHGG